MIAPWTISLGFADQTDGQILGMICFEFLHICPDELALKAADQVQFAIQWATRRTAKMNDELEHEKRMAKLR